MGTKSLVRSFRASSVVVYLLNLAVIINWTLYNPIYLNALIGSMTSIVTFAMLLVAMNGPKFLLQFIDNSRFGFLFTFRGRYCMDLFVSLFLYAMEIWGILMATGTLGLIFGIRFAGVRHPEAFRILFRQTADFDDEGTVYTDAGDTYDGTYDGTYEGGTVESGRR
mmetsp:Transcript_1123/g.1746  ORF Transcript_1123/g.1746 Transcript_1123/m.1746 type:complete len:166 (-) Transcript_1123:232-729(-)